MKKSFEIYSDCLDIVKRLKEIDKDYFVMYNLERKTFELHNHAQERDTFCLTLPFDSLDERAITLTKKTLSVKRDELFKEMEEENERNLKSKYRQILNEAEARLYES